MRNRAQTADDPVEFFVAECQRVTAGDKYVANLRCIFEIMENGFQTLNVWLNLPVADNA